MYYLTDFTTHVDRHVYARFPFSREIDPVSGNSPSWVCPPHHHLFQWVILNTLIFVGCTLIRKRYASFTNPSAYIPAIKPTHIVHRLFYIVHLISLTAAWIAIVESKIRSDTVLYLLQPCHLANLLLVFAYLVPTNSSVQRLITDHLATGGILAPTLAIAFADLRTYDNDYDIWLFFAQHYLILVSPALAQIARLHPIRNVSLLASAPAAGSATPSRSAPLAKVPCTFVTSWWRDYIFHTIDFVLLHTAYHWDLLLPLSIALGGNLNYTLAPPVALASAGQWYHVPLVSFCVVVTLTMGAICVLLPVSIARAMAPGFYAAAPAARGKGARME